MKIAIHHNGKSGFIRYNKGNREIMVTHPNELVRRGVRKYLTTKREFTVPVYNDPNIRGDRSIVELTPNEDTQSMKLALSEMAHHIGVHVNWGHEENILGEPDPNAGADKPILKSINEFDIINREEE